MRKLASHEGLTVIATVHQPSQAAFACFDDLLVMAEGGQMVYYGAASVAREYLEQASEAPCAPETNPAEFILGLLAEPRESRRLVDYYRAHPLVYPLADEPEPASAQRVGVPSSRTTRHFLKKLFTLARRHACVLWADKANLGLTLGQVPVIGLLMLLTFGGFQNDGAELEVMFRRAYLVSIQKDPIQREGRSVPIWTLLNEADARLVTDLISMPAARRGEPSTSCWSPPGCGSGFWADAAKSWRKVGAATRAEDRLGSGAVPGGGKFWCWPNSPRSRPRC